MAIGARSKVYISAAESTFGTQAAGKYALPFKSESLNLKFDIQKSEALLGKRGLLAVAKGKQNAEGSLDVEAFPNSLGPLFYAALGQFSVEDPDGTADSGDEYAKVTPITNTEDLPSFTVCVDHDGIKKAYIGAKVNSLKFEGSVGAIPTVSLDLIAKDEADDFTLETTPIETGNEPFYFTELKVMTGVGYVVEADDYSQVSININNNLDKEDYRLDGTNLTKSIDAGSLEITGNIDAVLNADTSSGIYADFKNLTNMAIAFVLTKNGKNFEIQIPKAYFTNLTHDIGDAGRIHLKGDFIAVMDDTDGSIIIKDCNHPNGY